MAGILNLPITDEEADYLSEVLDIWTQGYEEVQQEIVIDPTLDNPEDLMLAYSTASDDINRGKSILARMKYIKEHQDG